MSEEAKIKEFVEQKIAEAEAKYKEVIPSTLELMTALLEGEEEMPAPVGIGNFGFVNTLIIRSAELSFWREIKMRMAGNSGRLGVRYFLRVVHEVSNRRVSPNPHYPLEGVFDTHKKFAAERAVDDIIKELL